MQLRIFIGCVAWGIDVPMVSAVDVSVLSQAVPADLLDGVQVRYGRVYFCKNNHGRVYTCVHHSCKHHAR